MARSRAIIGEEIRALSTADKEALLRALWADLDGPSEVNVDGAWLAEAQRRDQEMGDGEVRSPPADEVFARLEASLKR